MDEPKSKSQLKREMHELQALGEQLVSMPADIVAQLPLDEHLADAIKAAHKIHSHGALKRQYQLIGKIMRQIDVTVIRETLAAIEAEQKGQTRQFHEIEKWRDQLLDKQQSKQSVQAFMDLYPATDCQHLRQLIRKAQHDMHNKEAYRQLFRYLRESVKQGT